LILHLIHAGEERREQTGGAGFCALGRCDAQCQLPILRRVSKAKNEQHRLLRATGSVIESSTSAP
jgi:hypothetical protein